jgi:hypothetical protein
MTLSDLYQFALSKINDHYLIELGIGDELLGERILIETEVHVAGFRISIDNYGDMRWNDMAMLIRKQKEGKYPWSCDISNLLYNAFLRQTKLGMIAGAVWNPAT